MSIRERLPKEARSLVGSDESSVLSSAAVLIAGLATRELVTWAWRRWRGEEPPENPADTSTGWGEAVAWTLAISAAVGTARLLARRGAAALERRG